MSIKITRNTTNTVVLTLTEKVTISAPYYFLFSFTSQDTNNTKNFIASDTSSYPDRYNQFSVQEVNSGSENLTSGIVNLQPAGFWNYKIYAQSSSSNLVPASANELVEEGIVRVIDNDVLSFNEYDGQSTTVKYYNPEE
jgi:hypothetical protein